MGRPASYGWGWAGRRGRGAGAFGGVVKFLVSAAAVAAIAWLAAPWVAIGRRGTLDRRALEAMRREVVVPGPRPPPDDEGRSLVLRSVSEFGVLPSAN